MVRNPFIFSQEEEEIVGRKEVLEELLAELKDKEAPLVFFVGRVGSGRTFFLEKSMGKLEGSDIDFEVLTLTSKALDDLKDIPNKAKGNKVIFSIDMFERFRELNKETQEEVLGRIKSKNDSGIGFILSVTPDFLKFLEEEYPKTLGDYEEVELRGLTLEEARKLVKIRLDRINENFPDIFPKKEFKRIWEQSNGNPRTILMTCAALFEKKVK